MYCPEHETEAVTLPGGVLDVSYDGGKVALKGPAVTAYTGTVEI